MKKIVLMGVLVFLSCCHFTRHNDGDNFIYKLLKESPGNFSDVIENAQEYEIQVLYTQINRNEKNEASFKNFSWQLDADSYFYPASTVKFPAAVLALEKLNNLGIKGLDKYTKLTIDSSFSGQTAVVNDVTSRDSSASIAHYIKKIFLVSDNDAFNRIYEFLGQGPLNKQLWEKGYKDVALQHRLSVYLSTEQNRHTNAFTFWHDKNIIFQQPPAYNETVIKNPLKDLKRGNGYFKDGEIVNEPFDFSNKNYISLPTLHDIMKSVIFPEAVEPSKRFNLTEDDYRFLYKYMSMFPRESDYPKYHPKDYWDSYVKFFIFGDSKEAIPEHIRIFNKVGEAYGYLIDVAYIIDFEKQVEFMLSAVIHVNANKIFNDGVYEYDTIGFPFLSHLGKVVYDYELQRDRKYKPDLEMFRMDYNAGSY